MRINLTPSWIRRHPVQAILISALSIAGACCSLSLSIKNAAIDPDSANPLILYDGIRHYGPHFLQTWSFTKDNWLFSLYPLYFLAFTLYGATPHNVFVLGWLVFIANSVLATIIAGKILNRSSTSPQASWLLPFFLFANPQALTSTGWLNYPVSHSITVLWGLIATLCFLRAFAAISKRAKGTSFCSGALASYIAVVSDPWGLAAFVLPTLAASAYVYARCREHRREAVSIAAASAVVLLLVKSRTFGLLDFLPRMKFKHGDLAAIARNASDLVNAAGTLYRPVPMSHPWSSQPSMLDTLVLLALAALLLKTSFGLAKRGAAGRPVESAFACIFAVAASLGPIAAYLISDLQAGLGSGRFFMTSFYLLPPLLLSHGSRNTSPAPDAQTILGGRNESSGYWARQIALACLLCVGGSGLIRCVHAALVTGRSTAPGYAEQVVTFLQQHRLTYGFGPYWGSSAETAAVLSRGQITILPVDFTAAGSIFPRRFQTSTLWYSDSTAHAHRKGFFVIAMNDGETCPDVDTCIAGLIRQFGPADRQLPFPAGGTVLVWSRQPPPILSQARPFAMAPASGASAVAAHR